MMGSIVLDASAVLAILSGKVSYGAIADDLEQAVMSAVNVAEVMLVLNNQGIPVSAARDAVNGFALTIVPFDAESAEAATELQLRALTKTSKLSLGDLACLSLAQRLKAPVLTADQAWKAVDVGIEIRYVLG